MKKNQTDKGAIKAPEEWVTGEEPMTGAQDSYVHTLAREAGEDVPDEITKAEASERIDELQQKTGRGARPKRKAAARKRGRLRGSGRGSSPPFPPLTAARPDGPGR